MKAVSPTAVVSDRRRPWTVRDSVIQGRNTQSRYSLRSNNSAKATQKALSVVNINNTVHSLYRRHRTSSKKCPVNRTGAVHRQSEDNRYMLSLGKKRLNAGPLCLIACPLGVMTSTAHGWYSITQRLSSTQRRPVTSKQYYNTARVDRHLSLT